jgi:tRNA(Ile)-lysidine synthase
LRAIRFVHIEGARRLVLEGQVGSWLSFPGGVRIARLSDSAEVTIGEPAGVPGVYELPVPGRVVAVEFGVHLTAEEVPRDQLAAQTGPARQDAVVLDGTQVGDEFVLRGPQPGDRFAPAGMGGRTKLVAEYLSDEKVPRHRRPFVPVLISGEGAIVWIVGMRASETARVTASTTRAVRVVARRLRA